MRRDLQGAAAALHTVYVALVMFIMVTAAFWVPNDAFASLFINLRSVTVEGDTVTVDRHINQSFWGRFSVTVRHAADHAFVCTTPPSSPFQYEPKAGAVNPKVFTLADWMGGPEALQRCEEQGFHDGTFILVTCHDWVPLGPALTIARRCVDSEPFERK